MRPVVEPEPFMVPARDRDHGQHIRIDLGPARRHRQRNGPEGADPAAQPRGKHLLQLRQRAQRGLLDPRDRAARGGAQSDRDRHRLLVVEQQGRQGTAGAETVPTGHARPRVEGAQLAQDAHDLALAGADVPRQSNDVRHVL